MDGLCLNGAGVSRIITPSPFPVGESRAPPAHVSTVSRRAAAASAGTNVSMETAAEPAASYSLLRPSRLFYPAPEKRNDDIALQGAAAPEEERGSECDIPALENGRQGSWAMKILHIRSIWPENKTAEHESLEQIQGEGEDKSHSDCSCCGEESEEGCRVGNDPVEFDRDSFSRLLRRVSLAEAKLFAQMSYLGNLAYSINKIKPGNLLKFHGLRFVTSSLEKKVQPVNSDKEKKLQQTDTEKEESTSQVQENEREAEVEKQEKIGYSISASAAYQIAAAAASYVQSHTRSILSFKSTKIAKMEDTGEEHNVHDTTEKCGFTSTQMASFVATTSSVTAVVAAEEEMKQSVAKDLNSAQSSPCEWFICDEDTSRTRFFVIQGSESMASWQANLLFEPIQFEGLDVLVHRGIYEAAKGIYERMLPEVMAHLKACGDSAKLRFTGHSLGGSLALLVNLMLLIRGGAPLSSLLPVITFGSPSIMCGGNRLLHKLGLPQSHVQAVTMHRDIVPRAFSCNYPDNVAKLLTAINGKFRNHPCLKNQKMLYAPMGELVILQPDEKISPHHHLLPSGSGLYLLSEPASQSTESTSQLRAAQTVFLNSPHPLEILSDPSAYGSEGTIYRDHDVNSYFRSVRSVLRQELNNGRKAKREQRRKLWWPIVVVAPQGINGSIIVGSRSGGNAGEQEQVTFWDVFRSGKESLSRFASQHPHILVFLLFPARSLLLGTLAVFSNFR